MTTMLSPAPTPVIRAPAASRASWCGTLEMAGRSIPIKAYPATVTPASGLCQLHGGCGKRIQQKKWCAVHGLLTEDEIVKACAYGPDDLIELSAAELQQLQPADDKTIRVNQFFQPAAFDPVLFSGRSLYLAPSHPVSAPAYLATLSALGQADVWGLAVMVLSGHRQPVIVRPARVLMLHVLHWPALCRACPFEPNGQPVAAADVRELQKVIGRLSRSVDWNELADDADAKLAELVQSKIAARQAALSQSRPRSRAPRQSAGARPRKAA